MATHAITSTNGTNGANGVNTNGSTHGGKDFSILFCATPVTGHLTPCLQIAKHLCDRGYDVTFMSPIGNKSLIDQTGAKFISYMDTQNASVENLHEVFPEMLTVPSGLDGLAWYAENGYVNVMPGASWSLRNALTTMRRREPDKEILIICETWYPGLLPYKLGAALPEGFTKMPKSLGISIIPPLLTSIDSGPFGLSLPFDNSEAGRAKNIALADLIVKAHPLANIVVQRETMLRICGATRDSRTILQDRADLIEPGMFDAGFACHDTTLQMSIPSLEYPYSDWPAHIKFGGTLPIKQRAPDFVTPPWFDQILANSSTLGNQPQRKKIIMVTQGTIALNHSLVVIPTLEGLAGRSDLLVVALLCVKRATLRTLDRQPVAIPDNAIVVDYFPYDELLPHVDCLVTNGSYGVYQHAAANGVPMVMAGDTEDKPEIGMRAERAGFAVNLRTGKPTPEMVAAGVDKILSEPKYKVRAKQLQAEVNEANALGTVEREMLALLK